jgi:hypothetical protein
VDSVEMLDALLRLWSECDVVHQAIRYAIVNSSMRCIDHLLARKRHVLSQEQACAAVDGVVRAYVQCSKASFKGVGRAMRHCPQAFAAVFDVLAGPARLQQGAALQDARRAHDVHHWFDGTCDLDDVENVISYALQRDGGTCSRAAIVSRLCARKLFHSLMFYAVVDAKVLRMYEAMVFLSGMTQADIVSEARSRDACHSTPAAYSRHRFVTQGVGLQITRRATYVSAIYREAMLGRAKHARKAPLLLANSRLAMLPWPIWNTLVQHYIGMSAV